MNYTRTLHCPFDEEEKSPLLLSSTLLNGEKSNAHVVYKYAEQLKQMADIKLYYKSNVTNMDEI